MQLDHKYTMNDFFSSPRTLSAKKLAYLVDLYKEKYGINIIINFTSEPGKKILDSYRRERMVEENRRIEAIRAALDRYNNPELNYVQYLIDNNDDLDTVLTLLSLDHPGYQLEIPLFFLKESYLLVMQVLSTFHETPYSLTLLNKKEKKAIQQAILSRLETSSEIKDDFELQIADKISELKIKLLRARKADDFFCFEMELVDEEMKQIRDQLQPGDRVGYVYTSGNSPDGHISEPSQHFEFFILTKYSISKPISWNSEIKIKAAHLPHCARKFIDSDFSPFIQVWESDGTPGSVPKHQASLFGCGTLGLACLKELLRDNARLLEENLISFVHCDEIGLKHFYMIPPPQLLRYAQSGVFTQIINAMVLENDLTTLVVNQRIYKITPIRLIIESSLARLESFRSQSDLIDNAIEQLDSLEQIRARWRDEFALAMSKRDTKQGPYINYYHAQKSQVYRQRAKIEEKRQKQLELVPLKCFIRAEFQTTYCLGWFKTLPTIIEIMLNASNFSAIKDEAQKYLRRHYQPDQALLLLSQAIISANRPSEVEDLYLQRIGMDKGFELF